MLADRIFVSYARKDADLIKKLGIEALLSKSVKQAIPEAKVYWDKGIPPGADWQEHLRGAGRESFAAVLLLSEHYFKSAFAYPEEYAKMLKLLMERGSIYVCPVLLTSIDEELFRRNLPELAKRQWRGPLDKLAKDKSALKQEMQTIAMALRNWRALIGNTDGQDPIQADAISNDLAQLRDAEFEGREWLFDLFQGKIDQDDKLRAIAIVGAPGIGKTGIATEIGRSLAHGAGKTHGLRGRLLAQHWCLNDRIDATGSPKAFVRAMAREFAKNHPSFAGVIDEEHVGAIVRVTDDGAGDTFLQDLILPLRAIIEDDKETYFIVVDALDQASQDSRANSIPAMLYRAIANFPPNLRLVVTILKGDKAIEFFPTRDEHIEHILLDDPDHVEEGKRDVETFARSWFKKHKEALGGSLVPGPTPTEFARKIVDASQGNFLIAKLQLRGIQKDKTGWGAGDLIMSNGLLGVYLGQFFKRRITPDSLDGVARLLGLMIAAGTTLPKALIDAAFGNQRQRVLNAIQAISALLKEHSAAVAFFHPHIKRWMENPASWQSSDADLDMQDFLRRVIDETERADKTLAGLSCPRQISDTCRSAKPLTAADVEAMKKTQKPCDEVNTSCSSLLRADNRLSEAVKRYSMDHGPRHFIRQHLLDCAVEFLVSPDDNPLFKPSENRERHVRMLMIEIGKLFSDHSTPNVDWATQTIIDRIVELVGDQYETEPFISVSRLIVESKLRHSDIEFPKELISNFKSDYVWRFAMAWALAHRCPAPGGPRTQSGEVVDWIIDMVASDELHFQELGSYALGLAYAANKIPAEGQLIDKVRSMAAHELYPPRSAFGDMMLSLAAQFVAGHRVGDRVAELLPQNWFKVSPWEHNKLDVVDWAALMQLDGHSYNVERTGAPDERVRVARAAFDRARSGLAELLSDSGISEKPKIEWALRNYWLLGSELALVRDAEDELRGVAPAMLEEIMTLLFSHPLWWVTEAASSVLASIAEISEDAQDLVSRLLEDRRWRVKLGAAEAAFDMRHLGGGKVYAKSIEVSWQDPNPRVRGLCAENLIANILEEKEWSARSERLGKCEKHLIRWFGDDDCWVLEHPYRLVQTFRDKPKADENAVAWHEANVKLDKIIEKAIAMRGALLDRQHHWAKDDRHAFLLTIEDLKTQRSIAEQPA